MIFEIDRDEDGRWTVEVLTLPGVMAYGATEEEALNSAEALAKRVIADRIRARAHGDKPCSLSP